MNDKGPLTKIFSKPPAKLTESDLHDEAVIRAITGTKQLRDEIAHWRERAEKAETDNFTMKHEFGAKLSEAKHDNETLSKENTRITAKMDHYQMSLLKLKTKINDLEMFFQLELKRMVDTINHSANGSISYANGCAATITAFLDDFHVEVNKTEYAPNEKPKSELAPLSGPDQSDLESLVSKLKAAPGNDTIQH